MALTILPSPAATMAHATQIAMTLRPGAVLALCGDLGTGKTHFTKGLLAGLGGLASEATSPTFALVHEYAGGRLPLYHFDFYRLESARDALRLGLDEYLDGDGVCVIEWADKFRELLPPGTRWFFFQVGEGEERTVREEAAAP